MISPSVRHRLCKRLASTARAKLSPDVGADWHPPNMANPIRPTKSEPCPACGGPVDVRRHSASLRKGDDVPQVVKVQVCTDETCSTNSPTPRLGDAL